MKLQKEKKIWTDYLLMAIFILVNGNPFVANRFVFAVCGLLSLLFLSMKSGWYPIKKGLVRYCIPFILVFIGQHLVLGDITILGSANLILKIITGATVMSYLGGKFRWVYLDVMVFYAAISLVLFPMTALDLIPNRILEPIVLSRDHIRSMVFYTYLPVDRNCGPFWEPGAFACYLSLIPLLFIDCFPELLKKNPIKMLVLGVALLTTFSTTGYIIFAIILLYFLVAKTHNKFIAYVFILPAFVAGMLFLYTTASFLQTKINDQVSSVELGSQEFSSSRFGSLVFDIHYILKHPIVGNGLMVETRFADNPELWTLTLGHGNGFSNFIAQMGIVIFLLYLIGVFKTLPFSVRDKLFFLVIIVLLMQGEQLLNYPLYLGLPFLIIYDDTQKYAQKKYKAEDYLHVVRADA